MVQNGLGGDRGGTFWPFLAPFGAQIPARRAEGKSEERKLEVPKQNRALRQRCASWDVVVMHMNTCYPFRLLKQEKYCISKLKYNYLEP